MGATLYGAPSATPSAPAPARRTETLALVYQQILTAIVRVRANRQGVADAQAFRTNILSAFRAAEKDGVGKGYAPEDVRCVTMAIVAFLDESVLNSSSPVFANWSPVQEELFGYNIGGEAFFENLDRLQSRIDSSEVADILEVYCLCMLLGFRGRYSLSGPEAIRPLTESLLARIRRIRGPLQGFSASWSVPEQNIASCGEDIWVRRLFVSALICVALALVVFIASKLILSGGVSSLRSLTTLLTMAGKLR